MNSKQLRFCQKAYSSPELQLLLWVVAAAICCACSLSHPSCVELAKQVLHGGGERGTTDEWVCMVFLVQLHPLLCLVLPVTQSRCAILLRGKAEQSFCQCVQTLQRVTAHVQSIYSPSTGCICTLYCLRRACCPAYLSDHVAVGAA